MDLPNMVATYEAMPEPLKAYLLFQLMRRSTLPTAQFICSYTQQHIRLDFIAELPSELSLHVISFLDVNSLCRSAQVSKCWRETIDSEPSIWRKRLLDDGLCRTEMEADGKLPEDNLEEWEKPEYWYMGGGNSKRIMGDLEANENNIQERAKSHPIPMLMTMASMDVHEEMNHDEQQVNANVDVEPTNMALPPAQQQQQQQNNMLVEPLPPAPHQIQEPMLIQALNGQIQAVQQEHTLGQQSPMHEIQPEMHNPAQYEPAFELAGTASQVAGQHQLTNETQPEEHEQESFALDDEMQSEVQTQDQVEITAPEPEMQVLEQHELPHEMSWPPPAPSVQAHFNHPNEGNANANATNPIVVEDVAPVQQQPVENAEAANTPATAALHPQIPNYAEFRTTTLKERYANALAAAAGKTGLLPLPNSGDDEACLKELDGDFLDVTDDEIDEEDEENDNDDIQHTNIYRRSSSGRRQRSVKKEESNSQDDLMVIDEDETTITKATSTNLQQQSNFTKLSLVTRHPYKRRYRRLYLLRANWYSGRARHLTFPAHGSNVVTCLHFDGRRIITGSDDNSVGVWDAATGALLRHMTGHEGGVWALAVCGDTVVSGSTDRSIRVWDIADGRCSHTLWGHTSTVRCCKIIMPRRMANGELCPRKPVIITGSRDATLRVWWLPSPRRDPPWTGMSTVNGMALVNIPQADPFLLHSWTGHTGSVRAVDGWGRWVVSGSYDSTVRIWDLLKGECRWRLSGHTQKVYSVSMMPGGEMCASGSMDGTVRVWRMSDGTCTWNLEGHTSLVGLLDLTPQQLISAAADATLRVWSLKSGESNMTLSGHTGAITCFQHDGIRIISGSDSTVKLWDQRQGRLIRDVLTGLSGVWQVRFDRRRCVAAVHRNNTTWIEVLDYILGSPHLNGHQDYDEPDGDAARHQQHHRCRRRRNRYPSVAENVLVTQEGLTSDNGNNPATTV
jgi:WD40 repeat protein